MEKDTSYHLLPFFSRSSAADDESLLKPTDPSRTATRPRGPMSLISLHHGGGRFTQRCYLLALLVTVVLALVGFAACNYHLSSDPVLAGHGLELSETDLYPAKCAAGGPPQTTIPNIVHYVYVLPDPDASDFRFHFSHYLSIYAVWLYWKPDAIYLHTNVASEDAPVTRARLGQMGKWTQLIFTTFDLKINKVSVPSHAANGVLIKEMEHKSDFVRGKAVNDFGGIYIDWDVHPLRDVKILRDTGFKAVVGRQTGGEINSGTFMSVKCSKLLGLWERSMHLVYSGQWTRHSNEALTALSERLVRETGEVLVMERDAFAPGGWSSSDNNALFSTHDNESGRELGGNTQDLVLGQGLGTYEEDLFDRWRGQPDDIPGWARDWSSTYLLHAFAPERFSHKVHGYKSISPRYVLERRSNFARAVYPVALDMYRSGILKKDDLDD